jgi:anti-sigma-K factor RskA
MKYDDPELRERLAAEYALGTMPSRSRRRFERLMVDDPALARIAAAWADRLTPLDRGFAAEEPPANVWRAIEARISGAAAAPAPAPAQSWWSSLVFWRGAALAACATATALIIYVAAFPLRTQPPMPMVIAVLADQSGDPSWIATTGPRRDEVSVRAVREHAGDGRHSLELWAITGGTPRPLGLLPPSSAVAAIIDAARLPPPGDLLAVSIEPPGGSPTGLPTGPVVSKGKVLPLP